MRAQALATAALLVLAAGTASFARAGSVSRTLVVKGEVESISASGGRVAIASGNPDGGCGHGVVWNASTGSLADLKDPCSSDAVYTDLTLAGDIAIWWDYSSGNHVYCDDVYTWSATSPKPHALGICDGTMGDTYFALAGDRSIAAIVDYNVCESDCIDNGNLLPDGDYAVEVRRVLPGKVARVLAPVDFRVFLDARNWRVAVIEPRATLAVYDARGKKLWSRPAVTGVVSGRIDGSSVVLHQTRSVRAYSPAGAGVARPLPKGASLDGVAGGLVVYSVGSSVRLLRLADGRDRKLVTIKGLVQAQLTSAGIFYGAGNSVTFVPIRTALQLLG